jgi:hypothetical protein
MAQQHPFVYENQVNAAEAILDNFQNTEVRHGLLRANEQSGKTGTYHYLINRMMDSGMINRAYILCGSNEIELRSQCEKDVVEWHTAAQQANIHVVFRQDFKRVRMTTERALIVVDESHLVELHNQTLSKYLADHRLSMAGTRMTMIRDRTYILSVDATPYAEESAMAYNQCHEKFKVILQDGEGYVGVKEYRINNQIRPTFNLVKGKEQFQSLLRSYIKKYILVRCQDGRRDAGLIRSYAEEVGCVIKNFTSKYMGGDAQITITKESAMAYTRKYRRQILSLEDEPERTTIVFVDGRLRCGKRVPKKHVGMVWESTKGGKTDIIRQGLLGRMCGYAGMGPYHVPEDEAARALIFVPERILKQPTSQKVVMLSDLDRSIADDSLKPRLANNIVPGAIQTVAKRNGETVTPCPPIRFQLDQEQRDRLAVEDELTVKEFCLNALCERMYLVNNNRTLTPEQKEEIKSFLEERASANNCHIRNYRGTSNQSMHKSHVEAYHTSTSASEHINGGDNPGILTFCVVYPGFQPLEEAKEGCVPGQVYAIFYTHTQGYFSTIHKESRISKVNNKTHFTIQISDEMMDCEGGGVYGFSPMIRQSAMEFSRQLELFIGLSKQPVGMFSKHLTSLRNGEFIRLPQAVYGARLERMKEIVEELQGRHNTIITCEVNRRRVNVLRRPDFMHELLSISWT